MTVIYLKSLLLLLTLDRSRVSERSHTAAAAREDTVELEPVKGDLGDCNEVFTDKACVDSSSYVHSWKLCN